MKLFGKNKSRFVEGNLLVIVVVLMVILSFATKNFFTTNNIRNLVRQTSVNGIIALGMTFVIISGGIDLSVGSIVGVASIVVSKLLASGMAIFPSVILALIVCAILGTLNGLIIHFGKVPPFIATLGMMQAARGIVMLLSNARMIAGLPKAFTNFSQSLMLGLPSLFFVWLLVIFATFVITTKMVSVAISLLMEVILKLRDSPVSTLPRSLSVYMRSAVCSVDLLEF